MFFINIAHLYITLEKFLGDSTKSFKIIASIFFSITVFSELCENSEKIQTYSEKSKNSLDTKKCSCLFIGTFCLLPIH